MIVMRRSITGLIVLLAFACTGCATMRELFRGSSEVAGVHKTVQVATLPPQPGPKLQEGKRELATVVRDYLLTPVLDEIAGYRALMAACQGVLVADYGAPAILPKGVAEVQRTLEAVQAGQAAFQVRKDLDAQHRLEDATKLAEASVRMTSGMLGTKVLLTGVGLGGVGLVGVLGWLWRKAKAGAWLAMQRYTVLSGALETVKVADPAAAEPVLQVLRAQPKAVQDDLSATRVKAGG